MAAWRHIDLAAADAAANAVRAVLAVLAGSCKLASTGATTEITADATDTRR